MKLFGRPAYLNTNHLGFCSCGSKELLFGELDYMPETGLSLLQMVADMTGCLTQYPATFCLPCLPLL